jgi:hypothetical protein
MLATKNWLKELVGIFYEAKLEISYIHNAPYPSAHNTETKVRKLPSDHLRQTPQGPQDNNSTLDLSQGSDKVTQQSSSPNLIYKVRDWRDRTLQFTDSSLKNYEEG